ERGATRIRPHAVRGMARFSIRRRGEDHPTAKVGDSRRCRARDAILLRTRTGDHRRDAVRRGWNGRARPEHVGAPMKTFEQIIYEKTGHVATVTFNRAAKMNAYSEVMVHETLEALADARDDDAIRAVILTGTGRGFCAGGD